MKNFDENTYTAIRKKFEQAAPELPGELHAKSIKEKIESGQSHKSIRVRKPVRWRAAVSTAACLVLAAAAVFGVFTYAPLLQSDAKEIGIVQSEEALAAKVSGLQRPFVLNDMGDGTTLSVPEEQPCDEHTLPSTVQANGQYAYYIYSEAQRDWGTGLATSKNLIYIFALDGTNTKLAAILDIPSDTDALHGIYLTENKLIAVFSNDQPQITQINVYDLADPADPQLAASFAQSGTYVSAHLTGGTIYLITKQSALSAEGKAVLPQSGAPGNMQAVQTQNIAYFDNARTAQYLVLTAVDAATAAATGETRAVLGADENVYYHDGILYIPSNNMLGLGVNDTRADNSTQIMTAKLTRKKITFTGEGTLQSTAIIRAMNEQNGYLRVAATVSTDDGFANRIYILNKKLQIVGTSEPFGAGMTIQSSAFINSFAYISVMGDTNSTLYTFDLSDAAAPTVTGGEQDDDKSVELLQLSDNRMLAVTQTIDEKPQSTLTLYDITGDKLVKIDQYILNNISIFMQTNLAIDSKYGYLVLPYYSADDNRRYYGLMTVKIDNDQISVTNEFANSNENFMTMGECIACGDYIYGFEINLELPDEEKVNIFAYKYE